VFSSANKWGSTFLSNCPQNPKDIALFLGCQASFMFFYSKIIFNNKIKWVCSMVGMTLRRANRINLPHSARTIDGKGLLITEVLRSHSVRYIL